MFNHLLPPFNETIQRETKRKALGVSLFQNGIFALSEYIKNIPLISFNLLFIYIFYIFFN